MRKFFLSNSLTDRIIYFVIVILLLSQLVNCSSGDHYTDYTGFFENKRREIVNNYLIEKKAITDINVFDSLTRLSNDIKWNIKGKWMSSTTLKDIGFSSVRESSEETSPSKKYISLKHFYLRIESDILVKDRQLYFNKSSLETPIALPVYFDADESKVHFLVSSTIHIAFKVLFYILIFVGLVIFLTNIFSLPIAILGNISKGKIFVESNYVNINFIARSILLYTTVLLLLNIILIFIFYPRVKEYFYFDWIGFFKGFYLPYIIGLAVLLLTRAFKKGYQLQNDSDLTV